MSKLFCLHGWGFSSKVFRGLGCLSIDLPAHGSSKRPYRNFKDTAKDIGLRIPNKSVLLGWSMGGSLALLTAFMFPQKVQGLILIGTAPHFRSCWSEKNIRAFLLRLRKEGESFLREFRRMAYSEEFEDTLDLQVAYRMLEDYINLDLTHLLPYIKQKTVIIQGTQDNIVPLIAGLSLYNLIKGSKFITFQGGHFPKGYEHLILEVLKSF